MEISIHDNWLYAHRINHLARQLVLHTHYPHSDPEQFTDVVFDGVVALHLEQMRFGPDPSNVLFSVEETDALFTLSRYESLLARTKNYAWPCSGYSDIQDLAAKLLKDDRKCYTIQGTAGLDGFVIARELRLIERNGRVE